jgi:hypothetical protein
MQIKTRSGQLALAIFGIMAGLGLGTAAYVKSLNLHSEAIAPNVQMQLPAWIEGDYPLRDDEEIGFVAREDASTLRHDRNGLNFYLFTDGRGARKNLPTPERPEHCDIITIGCSFSWGHGLENQYTYSSLIEKQTSLRVENFAMGSYGTVQSLLMLRRNKDLLPRYVIYGWIDEHLNRNVSLCAPNYIPVCAATPYIDTKTLRIMPPIRSDSMARNQQFYERMRLGLSQGQLEPLPRSPAVDMDAKLQATRFLLKKMQDECDSIGAQLIVVDLTRASTGKKGNSIIENILPSGVLFIDMTDRAASWPNKSELHFPTDSHPSKTAHRLIAQEIIELLATLESKSGRTKTAYKR